LNDARCDEGPVDFVDGAFSFLTDAT